MRICTYIKIAVSLVSLNAAALEIKVTKFSKQGMSEMKSVVSISQPAPAICKMAVESAIGSSEAKAIDKRDCGHLAKLIRKIQGPSRSLKFIARNCPASYEEVMLDSKAKLYCIKGRKSDGKAVRHLNRYLSILSARHLGVDF